MVKANLTKRFIQRQRGALARLLTYIENDNPIADDVMASVATAGSTSMIIGITGPPGAGKSTLTNAMIAAYRKQDKTVGVLAVDPSSALTGGATLGDRVRMLETYDDDGVYIRSMATRGQYGGLTMATHRATQALEAFGFDVIILETVGVGQDEVDIASQADTTLLLQVPGLGDSIQTIKAGILEIADILVVNKAELPEARTLQRDLRAMLRYRGHPEWATPVVPTVASTGEGIDALMERIEEHGAYLHRSGEYQRKRDQRAKAEIHRLARANVEKWVASYLDSETGKRLAARVVQGEISNMKASQKVIELYRAHLAVEDAIDQL